MTIIIFQPKVLYIHFSVYNNYTHHIILILIVNLLHYRHFTEKYHRELFSGEFSDKLIALLFIYLFNNLIPNPLI